VANHFQSDDLPSILLILCLVGGAICLTVLIGVHPDLRTTSVAWSVVNVKFFSLLLAGLISLSIGLICLSKVRPLYTVLGIVSLLLMILYIFQDPSTAAHFALLLILISAIGFGIVNFYWKFFRWSLLESGLVSVAILGASLFLVSYFSNLKFETDRFWNCAAYWEASEKMLVESNFLGVGRGNWQTKSYGLAQHGWRLEHAHSDIFEILAEVGPVGLGAYLVFLYGLLRLRTGQMGFWLKLSLLTFFFESLFWSLLHYAVFVPFFWIIAGMIWVDRKHEKVIIPIAGRAVFSWPV